MRKVKNGLGSVGRDQGDNVRLQDLALTMQLLTMQLACWTLRDFGTSGTGPYKPASKWRFSYMTGCVEIYTDVNYHSEYGQSQEN